ncbi:MAG: Lrp/AsnC family transcriptional regulator [Pseudomonadota bacterium]
MDDTDRRILRALQQDCGRSLDALADAVGMSRNAVWRRVRILEERGVLRGRVALVDGDKVGLALRVFIQVRTDRHARDWSTGFARAARAIPEILGVYRMTGDLDYLIEARVADMADYDRLYQKLTEAVELRDVSASFVMEVIKETTALPV